MRLSRHTDPSPTRRPAATTTITSSAPSDIRQPSLPQALPISTAKWTLVDRLERILPEDPDKKLPNELVMLILEHMMTQSQQPVRRQATSVKLWSRTVADPSVEKCIVYFHSYPFSLQLRAMAREAYFKVNTIRIDAPIERSPKQILRSELFTRPWASDIYDLELVHTLQAEQYEDWPRRSPTTLLEQRDVERVVTLVGSLKQALPNLHRLTLMLTVQRPICFEDQVCGFERRHRRLSISGQLCSMLEEGNPGFMDAFVDEIAPALKAIDLKYAAFKWRVSCGHDQCKKWFGSQLEANGKVMRLDTGSEHTTAVLRH